MTQAPLHRQFPPDFVWGVATSSFQIEGAAHEDGKGESIWDAFCRQPGAIADASNGDVACDHFHRLESDLDLIASLGVNCYRFSIAWPRVQALGHGEFNARGLDFYERLVDGLKARGIRAFATLNHWDLPQGLQDRGGWNDRDTVHRFVDYARHVQARLGDRLDGITTHNEPWVVAVLGHEQGSFAPGIKSRRIAAQVCHHLLLSHGLALQALRADGARSRLGIVLNLSSCVPATAMPEDIAAAALADARGRRWYADPLFKGSYPEEVLAELGADAPVVQAGDMGLIAQPMDYFGVNYYTRTVVSAGGQEWDAKERGLPVTDMGWEVYAPGLTDLLLLLHRDYPGLPPVYVTENGGAFKDGKLAQGRVQDDDRIAYLRDHIAAVASAMRQGVPMAGYMVWSLLDNFEWASGYLKRFGIVHVDYATQARTPKASAEWYRDFLAAWRGWTLHKTTPETNP
ncbi:GH1 family beta-glucosidase [Pelomonas aquatica]|jgi:beta-glucosidase|uniref:Beta-glucosidase n=1 Tax=Pelomonas aquatica TaxID=431058 RepID=A0A9X4R5K1_9BURK|nr:GH1 family beta-glucosidase [Pelomonas aquatica]MCY4753664.1 GH1 family beta-glucosidase [Pelomonas aquatica]MDG0863354.1 beta-glucosidase [Pelomonas aquatica]